MSPVPDEPVLVVLTRMEGKLDRVADRVTDLRARVDNHENEIGVLKSTTQSLQEGAAASKDTAVALALALKDAKETAEGAARSEAAKMAAIATDQTAKAALGWSPITKLFAVVAALAFVVNIYQAFKP